MSARKKQTSKNKSGKLIDKRRHRPCVAEYVEWNYVPKIGRGVIARMDILKGAVIERSPVVVAPCNDFEAKHGRETVIDHYLLTWPEKGEDKEYAVGLGYLMLYNHSSRPNAVFRNSYKYREVEVVALRDIEAGEEITHDYGGVWFTPRKEPVKKPAAKKSKPKAKAKAKAKPKAKAKRGK